MGFSLIVNKKHFTVWAALLVFALAFLIYFLTLAPTIHLEDSAEFAASAAILGIPHPSGYPLYSLLGYLFTVIIPFGEMAWRVNLMSAFFGALACSFLFLIILQIFGLLNLRLASPAKNRWSSFFENWASHLIAFSCSLCLAFSFSFWSQSIIAEVYTLNIFLLAILIWLLLKWTAVRTQNQGNQPHNNILYLFSFIYGLSLTNHTMMILAGPIFLIYIVIAGGKKIITDYKFMLGSLLLFLIGLSVYFYLPIRSLANPPLDWGNPESWQALWEHISRKQYADFAPLASVGGKLVLAQSFFANLSKEFNLAIAVLGLAGLIITLVKKWRQGLLLLLVFLVYSLGIIFLRNYGWGLGIESTYNVYYLPCHLTLMVGLAVGLFWLVSKIIHLSNDSHIFPCLFSVTIFALALLIMPVSLFVKNYYAENQSRFYLVDHWACASLESLAPNAILISRGDGFTGDAQSFSLAYFQMVKKIRPDVLIVDDGNVFLQPPGWRLTSEYPKLDFNAQEKHLLEYFWQYAKLQHRPLYSIFPRDTENLTFRSNGFVYQVFSPETATTLPLYISGSDFMPQLNFTQLADDFLASRYYALAANLLENSHKDYTAIFLKAIDLDAEPFSNEYQSFIKHRARLNRNR